MFIAQNPIERSVVVVVTFWYTTLFALSGFHGVPVWHVVYLFPVSLLITAAGGVVSIMWMIATYRKSRGITGEDLKAGSRVRQAVFSLGGPQPIPVPTQARHDDLTLLNAQPWWKPIQQRNPLVADAIRAVLRIMNTCPRFPASPIPGGHGGRTLIEHSLAVAGQMLREANGWVYRGQIDKQGNVRVPLQSGRPHRFTPSDAPLLVLTGLAHDIGKLACWEVIPDHEEQQRRQAGSGGSRVWRGLMRVLGRREETGGRRPPLRVNEVLRMHDTEGARLLRRVTEIMVLPVADRGAMLAAIGYYHHPMALPLAPWVTDKVRSLTELLIRADIETGKQEGHTLTEDDPDREYGDEDAQTPDAAQEQAVEDAAEPDINALLEAGREEQQQVMQQGDYEFRLLEEALHKPGAVNAEHKHRLSRIAWKRGDWIYVMEPLARRIIANSNAIKDPLWAAMAFDEVNGNACPFTKALLQQLDARGLLLTTLHDRQYPPTRALFRMQLKEKGDREIPVFVVKASAFPELYAPDPPKDHIMKLTRPLWGEHTARPNAGDGRQEEEQGAVPAQASLTSGKVPPPIHTPITNIHPAEPAPSEPVGGLDEADIPFDMGADIGARATRSSDSEEQTETASAQTEPDSAAGDIERMQVDTADILLDTVLTSDWPVIRRKFNDKRYVLVDVNSVGGQAIRREVQMMKSAQPGIDFADVPTATLHDLGITTYAFEVTGG